MKNIFTLLILIYQAQLLYAVDTKTLNYDFIHITSNEGLSQSNVKTIIQDSYGFMWFGTKNGLNRYDGTSIKIFNCEDKIARKGDNNISALFEDSGKKLWIGTDKGVYLFDPITETFRFMDILTENGKQMANWVADIQSDLSGNIWILIPNQGIFKYQNEQLYHYEIIRKENPAYDTPECICITKSGEVWIGTNGAGLFLYDNESDTFQQYITDKDGNSLKGKYIFSICEYGDNIAVAIHEEELKKFNPATNSLTNIKAPSVHYTVLRDLACFNDRELWIATHAGLFVIDETENKVTHYKEDLVHPYSLSDNIIYTIYKDKEDGIWLGTLFGGVNYLPGNRMEFDKYIPLASENSLSGKRIRELAKDTGGNIWIGTDDEGLNILNTKTGEIKPFEYQTNKKNNSLKTLAVTSFDDKIWCGIFKKGMNAIQLPSLQIKSYNAEELQINEGSVYALFKDQAGNIWLGTAWGLFCSSPGELHFKEITDVGNIWIYHIMEDDEQKIWIASLGNGVFKYDPAKNTYKRYQHFPGDQTSLSSNSVSDIMQDSKGRLWFSTDRGGICLYNKNEDNFTTWSVQEGLPDDVAYRILEDRKQNLWFGTNRGLVKFNPDSNTIRVYTKEDGLLGNQFNYKSAITDENGKFYFGSIEGLIAFNPEKEITNDINPPVYITKLSIYNNDISVHSDNSPLEKSIIHTDHITLPYNQSNVGFDFAALNYKSPTAIQYAYKMEGIDKDWIQANSNKNITYSRLPPGNYKFIVKATNKDIPSVSSEKMLGITILPPLWLSPIAYFVYIILIMAIIARWFYWYENRQKRQIEEGRKIFEIEKEKELYSSKIEFFTEIAHEVRTPLTLINGPLETIMDMDIQDGKIKKNLQVIAQNTKRLLELTKQLLDFRKVGETKFLLDFIMLDVTQLLKETIQRFEPTIIQQGKKLIQDIPEQEITAAVDKEALTKIISNLLNNALKYSESLIQVILLKEQTSFTIKITSDGDKIPEELNLRIFDPFFQINKTGEYTSGAGIGLPLSKSLAELHNGKLYLDAGLPMNTFILTLPLHQEKVIHLEDYSKKEEYLLSENELPVIDNSGKKTILLVEDNEEVRTFIAEKLRQSFIVETATHGIDALEVLKDHHIDLVISDVMMPRMGGFELCTAIKSNMELSHIPFIFLTAKDDLDSKINGLKIGAEAYVEKPFSFDYLQNQIHTLLNNRQKERESFAKRPFFPVHNMKMNKADEAFMDKIIQVIHENIDDYNFNVERLAEIVSMSRSGLLRKIKVLTNLSPIDFIRLIRLKKAAELILEGKHRIGEICYMVGINSPSYFSKLFLRQFGMTPKDFEKQNQFIKGEE